MIFHFQLVALLKLRYFVGQAHKIPYDVKLVHICNKTSSYGNYVLTFPLVLCKNLSWTQKE